MCIRDRKKAEIVMETEGRGYEEIAIAQSNGKTQIQIMVKDLFLAAFIILIFTAMAVGLWIYRSIAAPLVKLKKATQNIKAVSYTHLDVYKRQEKRLSMD